MEKPFLTLQPTQMLRLGQTLEQENFQDAYFDVRVFHPNASSYVSKLSALFCTHEHTKKREYRQCIRDVEHGVFTPLVFSTSGAMGRDATTFYKRLADVLSEKQDKAYFHIMGWLRCRLSFAILRSAIMCLRGCRSSYQATTQFIVIWP